MQNTSTSTSSSSRNHSNKPRSGFGGSIPHHLLWDKVMWDNHQAKLPDNLQHLYYCKCQGCKKARLTYIHSKQPYSGYDEGIPHHLLWDFHKGKFPDYLQQLHKCLCQHCDDARDVYTS